MHAVRTVGLTLIALVFAATLAIADEIGGERNEAVEHSQECATKAVAAIRAGDLSAGRLALIEAIQSNPGDAGVPRAAALVREPTPTEWGDRQLELMLADRPAMKEHVTRGDILWKWTSTLFGGQGAYVTSAWDNSAPTADADHIPATSDEPGHIRVRSIAVDGEYIGSPRSFEALWSSAVYELHNVQGSMASTRTDALVRRGGLSESQYVRDMFTLEFIAVQETRAFYAHVYLPWAESRHISSDPHLWFVEGWWGSADQCFARFDSPQSYPWKPYRDYFQMYATSYLDRLASRDPSSLTAEDIVALRHFAAQDGRCVQVLADALGAVDATVRRDAHNVVMDLKIEQIILDSCLLPRLKSNPTVGVVACIGALGQDSAKATSALIESLESAEDDVLKMALIKTLHACGKPADWTISRALPLLESADRDAKLLAIDFFCELGPDGAEATSRLLPMLNDSDKDVSSHALDTLIAIRGSRDGS